MFNYRTIVRKLAESLDEDGRKSPNRSRPRRRTTSEPVLLARLPTTGVIQREADRCAPLAEIKALRRTPSPTTSLRGDEEDEASEQEEEGPPSPVHRRSSSSSPFVTMKSLPSTKSKAIWRDPEPYEIFRAIEKKDLIYLMEVRDRAFHLLLRKSGNATPLVHAMRLGKSHREVAIVLLGALSRWVNHLEDDEFALPQSKTMLKALRVNLKLAIDHGLQTSESDLIASFLQTLIMSEGNKWVAAQTSNVALALRAGTEGKPVETAEAAVRSFATRELGKAQGAIAALEDYVSNATADLLILGAWSCVMDTVTEAEAIPLYYFARDDRVYKAFADRLATHQTSVNRTSTKRLKWQLRVLRRVMEGRTTTFRSKVAVLAGEFDEGTGI